MPICECLCISAVFLKCKLLYSGSFSSLLFLNSVAFLVVCVCVSVHLVSVFQAYAVRSCVTAVLPTALQLSVLYDSCLSGWSRSSGGGSAPIFHITKKKKPKVVCLLHFKNGSGNKVFYFISNFFFYRILRKHKSGNVLLRSLRARCSSDTHTPGRA